MPRRRVGEYFRPVTISLRPWMIAEIETLLGPKQSRSEWIASAIDAKLDDSGTKVADATDLQLVVALRNREVINEELYQSLRAWLD